jgi:hypothetical protein
VDGGLAGRVINATEETKIKITDILKKMPGPPDEKPVQRFERKFAVPAADIGFAYTLLRQICRPDREYPKDYVRSLYFDTADLDQYEKSAAGDFMKKKVRIRWYDSDAEEQGEKPVWLELKSREGFASSKERRKFTVPPLFLKPANLNRGVLDKTTIMQTLATFGYFPEKPIKPIILISYRRYRFSEMQTGVRVCLDSDIRASVVAPELGRHGHEVRLEGGVIEVKGPSIELPVTLRYMRILDVDWSRFSKYGGCLDAHFARADNLY